MRRILGVVGIWMLVGGTAALTPILATIGAGVTLTLAALAISIWRWMRRRSRQAPVNH